MAEISRKPLVLILRYAATMYLFRPTILSRSIEHRFLLSAIGHPSWTRGMYLSILGYPLAFAHYCCGIQSESIQESTGCLI